ncbi:MAG: NADH-quinone oxidoreductase subunit NuoE family protein [Candidatus Asgardarchaeia archaeon]
MEGYRMDGVIDEAINRYGKDRKKLIAILQYIQKKIGYLPREAIEGVSNDLGLPISEVYSVATFYHQFVLEKPGKHKIWVCMGTACHLKGNDENYRFLKEMLGLGPDEKTTKDGLFTLEKARCFGCCSLAPVIKIDDDLYGEVDTRKLRLLIAKYKSGRR